MTEDTVTISCEVRIVGDSLAGRASIPQGVSREFTGWLGLLGALHALLTGTGFEPLADVTPAPPVESGTDPREAQPT